jgi:hypothetical protein
VVGVLLFAASAAVLVLSLWGITDHVGGRETRLVAAFVVALAFLLFLIAGIVAAFHALELTNPRAAFGLPEGSIRAIIALVLILIFVVMAIYLVEAVYLDKNTSTEAQTAATQILATVGTLVAAVAAFYFGTAAVTAGTKAATSAVEAARASTRPSAITKGSKPLGDNKYELVGIVNPRGLETQYYFEYGKESTYGNKTVPASAGAANAERQFSTPALELEEGWHLRVVAFNDAGTSYGADAVTDPAPPGETEAGASEPESTAAPETGTGGAQLSGVAQPDEEGSAEDEPDLADAQLPADEDEEAEPPPDDDSTAAEDPDAGEEASQ